MMRYLRWRYDPPLAGEIDEILTEFDEDGYAERELGLNAAGAVVHRKPSDVFRDGRFGYFDERFQVDEDIKLGSAEELEKDAFERAWLQLDAPPLRRRGRLAKLLGGSHKAP